MHGCKFSAVCVSSLVISSIIPLYPPREMESCEVLVLVASLGKINKVAIGWKGNTTSWLVGWLDKRISFTLFRRGGMMQ